MTASIGVGKAESQTQAISHIKSMMAYLDANALVSVKENYAELAEKMNTPDQCKFWWLFLIYNKKLAL